LHVVPAGPIQTNAYLLSDPARSEAVLIDAPGNVWPEIETILAAEKCRLVELWLTHGHWDHMQGAAEVVRATGAKTRGHPADRLMFETPEMMERFMGERLGLKPVKIDSWLTQGERLAVLGTEFEVLHVPGHCPGNVLFYLAGAQSAFVGDALFRRGIGRTDLPGGDFDELERSIRTQIYSLPGATIVYPGHGQSTTVAEEIAENPYVSG
jgi:glyoxylase-like metal-dependent hydrolase (beta-lactamase superfamily II)